MHITGKCTKKENGKQHNPTGKITTKKTKNSTKKDKTLKLHQTKNIYLITASRSPLKNLKCSRKG